MRLRFVVLLLTCIAGALWLRGVDQTRCRRLREDCAIVEGELAQCETARKAIRKEERRLRILTKDVERLRQEVKALER